MSYHETYEFFAIDRRLTPAEMRALRNISTRATITPTRFYNFYDWGGLKADPSELVHRYFDLFVYTELSSGGRSATLRFPADRIDRRVWRTYVAERRGTAATERCASLMLRGETVLLDLLPAEDPRLARSWSLDDHDEDEEWMGDAFGDTLEREDVNEGGLAVPLALVRADLLARDLRALYLLWLCSVQGGERRATTVEPPRPPGLDGVSHLSGVLASFAEFMRLDEDLLAVALESPRPTGRTAGALVEAARSAREARRRRVAKQAAVERARRLARLEERAEDEWIEVARLVEAKKARDYDDAVRRLLALQELSVDRGKKNEFAARMDALLAQHRSKHAFLGRVRSAGLVPYRDH